MPKVTFVTEKNEKKVVDVPVGANLRKQARENGIPLAWRVQVTTGQQNVSPPGLLEKLAGFVDPLTFSARIGHEDEIRLACCCTVQGDCTVKTSAPLNLEGEVFWQ